MMLLARSVFQQQLVITSRNLYNAKQLTEEHRRSALA